MEVLFDENKDRVLDGQSRLEWVEYYAARSEKFKRSLGNIYVSDEPPDVFARLERAAGVSLPRPRECPDE